MTLTRSAPVGSSIFDGPFDRNTKVLRELDSPIPEERSRVRYERAEGVFSALSKLPQDLAEVLISLETIDVLPKVIEGGPAVLVLSHEIPLYLSTNAAPCRPVASIVGGAPWSARHLLDQLSRAGCDGPGARASNAPCSGRQTRDCRKRSRRSGHFLLDYDDHHDCAAGICRPAIRVPI